MDVVDGKLCYTQLLQVLFFVLLPDPLHPTPCGAGAAAH
jgi:hypothetical protein